MRFSIINLSKIINSYSMCNVCVRDRSCKYCRLYGKEEGKDMYKELCIDYFEKMCDTCNLDYKCFYCRKYGEDYGKEYQKTGKLF